jgi:ANTAR domain-containing protein
MAQRRSGLAAELQLRLKDELHALQSAAEEIGASSVSVFLIKEGRTLQRLYSWPESDHAHAEMLLDPAVGQALLDGQGYVPESSRVAQFLNRIFQAGGTSFLLSSCGEQRHQVTISFGLHSPPRLACPCAPHVPRTARLAAVATWSLYEVARLHSELSVVNERLGQRKLVERAKGMLQAKHGLDEQQAYEHLRKLSRQRRVRMAEIAKHLLGTVHFP